MKNNPEFPQIDEISEVFDKEIPFNFDLEPMKIAVNSPTIKLSS